MQEYTSKTVKIDRPAELIYSFFADLSKFAQVIPPEHANDLNATVDECTFSAKGMSMGVKVLDRTPFSMVKYMGIGKVPFEFLFWVQLKEVAPNDTRMRLVLHAKLNFAMRMMFKGKIQSGLDSAADQVSGAFNGTLQPPVNFNQEPSSSIE